ncbi:MAG: SDR family oxidoreductase [Steroidobacteraceae bacterium]|jgi:NAD(P)-dependent dehydrogenase (short-subunit alcohol dehydrogenase family)
MIDFAGRTALVTGGGSGIGRGIAEAFDKLGARVVVAEIDRARADDVRASLGTDALVSVTDVRDTPQVDALLTEVEQRYGRLDILVNNVGDFLGISKSLEEHTDEDFDALYAVNLRHLFQVTRAALPLMKKSGPGGSIINISTIEAFRGIPKCIVYSAFKAGVSGFTRSLALDLGPSGIRVNEIAPETTETGQVKPSQWIPATLQDHIPRWIPLGRFGQPADAAGCAVFLASELSGWVTGTTLHLDGGALAAGGWYRAPDGRWTNTPVVTGSGIGG